MRLRGREDRRPPVRYNGDGTYSEGDLRVLLTTLNSSCAEHPASSSSSSSPDSSFSPPQPALNDRRSAHSTTSTVNRVSSNTHPFTKHRSLPTMSAPDTSLDAAIEWIQDARPENQGKRTKRLRQQEEYREQKQRENLAHLYASVHNYKPEPPTTRHGLKVIIDERFGRDRLATARPSIARIKAMYATMQFPPEIWPEDREWYFDNKAIMDSDEWNMHNDPQKVRDSLALNQVENYILTANRSFSRRFTGRFAMRSRNR